MNKNLTSHQRLEITITADIWMDIAKIPVGETAFYAVLGRRIGFHRINKAYVRLTSEARNG